MQKLESMENRIIEKETKLEDGKYVRLGVIGCGKMTMVGHIHAFGRLKNAKITALCDIRIEAAKEVAKDAAKDAVEKYLGVDVGNVLGGDSTMTKEEKKKEATKQVLKAAKSLFK